MSAPKPLAAKKLTISVVDEDGKKYIIKYEGRIFLQYTIQHDVGPIDGRRRVLIHLGGFSTSKVSKRRTGHEPGATCRCRRAMD